MPRVRQNLGKYRIEKRLGEGGFARVYQAYDTIEGIRVALKVPYDHLVNDDVLEQFRKEVRLAAKLDHPNILPLKNAEVVDGHFVLAYPLADETLAERTARRMSLSLAFSYAEQLLAAIAHAHQHRVIHCDIKPDNMLLFPGGRLLLTDFGIARVAMRTIRGSGSGTVGYIAPEQAMGRPSFRSDVFSAGLIIYRLFAGKLPEWPYEWPAPGASKLRGRVPPDFIQWLRRSIEVTPRKRFRDAIQMAAALDALKPKMRKYLQLPSPAGNSTPGKKSTRRKSG